MAAETPGFLQADSYGAVTFRQMFSSLFGAPLPGVLGSGSIGGVVNLGDLLVTQNGTPNMSVEIAGGQIWIPGTTASNQAMYYGLNDATVNLAVAASNPSNPRIDVPCGTIKDAAYAGASNNFTLQVITGTPAASPVVPSLPASSAAIADVTVPAGASTITTGDITDERTFVPTLGNAQQGNPAGRIVQTVAGTAVTSGGTPIGGMTQDFVRGGMAVASDTLVVPVAGIYQISWSIDWGAQSGGTNLDVYALVYKNGAPLDRVGMGTNTSGNFPGQAKSMPHELDAGDVLQLWGSASNVSLTTQNSGFTDLAAVLVSV
jgi:hypothetical protein